MGRIDSRVRLSLVPEVLSRDILALEGVIFGLELRLILVYFDCTKLTSGDDYKRNKAIEKEVNRLIRENRMNGLMVLGDFNGHLSILENDRGEDVNGRMVIKLMDEYNLHLMNADERCKGTYRWGRLGQKSAIDMILVNNAVFKCCGEMFIDESGLEVNFSDHNMVSLELRLRERGSRKFDRKGDQEGKVVVECTRTGEM